MYIRYKFACIIRELTLPKTENKMATALTCLGDKRQVKDVKKIKTDIFRRKVDDRTQKLPWEMGGDISCLPALHNFLNF